MVNPDDVIATSSELSQLVFQVGSVVIKVWVFTRQGGNDATVQVGLWEMWDALIWSLTDTGDY